MEKMATIKNMGFIIDIVLGVLLLVYLIQGARKGFWRLIMPLIVAVVIFLISILLSTTLASALYPTDLGEQIYNFSDGLLKEQQFYEFMVNIDDLANYAPQALATIHLPEALSGILVHFATSLATTQIVALGPTLASGMTMLLLTGVSFLILYAGLSLVYLIILLLKKLLFPFKKKEPAMYSRILGMLLNLVRWAIMALGVAFVIYTLTSLPMVGENISNFIGLNDSSFSITKWLINDIWIPIFNSL